MIAFSLPGLAPLAWIGEALRVYAKAGSRPRAVTVILIVTAMAVSILGAPGIGGILGAVLAVVMLAIALVDWACFIIPNELTGTAFVLALANAAIAEPGAVLMSMAFAGLRAAVMALIFLSIRAAYKRWRGRDGMGLGDVKLAAVAGAWLDWPLMAIAVEIGACAALLAYFTRQLVLGRPFG